ncbi:DNA primase [Marinibactrum halimedae]|uniref:DNA primase n=1 Tax=Marinibactrum halimedae TaxID=1444977 RepID=A0AA37WMX3_9GAMM|nr:DNA primase [Marinibactrum halimedae]MCD9459542.1 DNA primase [Marinibactrum halimedae]GLS25641.1 DNA primase [Marinibactrum halimedae]
MPGQIPQPFIDDLLERLDIVDIIDSRVKLKRTGKNYSACCPFHEEKTPSFTVSPDKQFYYCFGCGASGNAVGFVMDYDKMAFPEAVESLAKLAGVDVPKERHASPQQAEREKKRKLIYRLLDQASNYYQQQLRKHKARREAAEYLRQRGLTGHIAKSFELGFAPPGWNNLIDHLRQENPELKDSIESLSLEAGLLVEHAETKRRYDRFRHRIVFPIKDVRGRTIGFGGRVLGNDKPKYLNSPETPVFHKGKELYGLHRAKQNGKQTRLVVVEGYMDVVALAQFGIDNAIATLGTACGEDHLNLAFKHTSEIVFCFDGDAAGRQAAKRALENCLPTMTDGRQVKFLFLPNGEDPDTIVRSLGAESFTNMVENAVPLEDYLFDAAGEDLNVNSMEGRARLSKAVVPMLNRLPTGVYRELMFDNLAKRTGLSRDTLSELINIAAPDNQPSLSTTHADSITHAELPTSLEAAQEFITEANTAYFPPNDTTNHEEHSHFSAQNLDTHGAHTRHHHLTSCKQTPEKRLCTLLLQHSELVSVTTEFDLAELNESSNPDTVRFLELLELLKQRPHYSLSKILGYWRAAKGAEDTEQLASLIASDLLANANKTLTYDVEGEYRACFAQLIERYTKQKRQKALEKLKVSTLTGLTREEKQQLLNEVLKGRLN